MHGAIRQLRLDLSGIDVLTEAASGPFVVTCLLAALAGSPRVIAVTRDSGHGRADDVAAYVTEWGRRLEISRVLHVTSRPASAVAAGCSLVTNVGFVRPIDAELIRALPSDAAIALMFEAWEFRSNDVDLAACALRDIPVAATCETDPRLQLFRYVGVVVLRLLLEAEIEVFRSTVLLMGSDPFGAETATVLSAAGAHVIRAEAMTSEERTDLLNGRNGVSVDAIVVAEYRSVRCVIGGDGLSVAAVAELGAPVIHLCGVLDYDALVDAGAMVIPPGPGRAGFMKVTTGYVGPRPVIDLHAGGLKVGELLVRGRRATGTASGAIRHALADAITMPLNATS